MMKSFKVIIKGNVQGVFFRASTLNEANRLGIKGSVKNMKSGFVEVVMSGTKDSLSKMIEWCLIGPEQASVKQLKIDQIELQQLNAFEIIR